VLTGLLIGSVVGAVTMLLYAPRSGQETRAGIRTKALEVRDRTSETVKDTVTQAKSKAHELKDTVQAKAEELKSRGKHTITRQLDQASQALETNRERVREF
jgi:gas vesicle protein